MTHLVRYSVLFIVVHNYKSYFAFFLTDLKHDIFVSTGLENCLSDFTLDKWCISVSLGAICSICEL